MDYTEQNEILQEKKFKIKKIGTNSMNIRLQECGFEKQSETCEDCGSRLVFSRQEHIQTKEQRSKLIAANFCKFRFCLMCNWRRVKRIGSQLIEALEYIETTKSVSYLFLTLTVKNPETGDLKATVQRLNKSFFQMSNSKVYKKTILGCFKALELLGDKTQANEVHPHFHILLIVSNSYFTGVNYLSQKKWVAMWRKALGVDYDPQVNIKKIRQKNNKTTATQSVVAEIAKYAIKHSDLTEKSDDEFIKIINQTRNMRFYSASGLLKNELKLIKLDEDLIGFKSKQEVFWKELEKLFFIWRDGDYRLNPLTFP